MMCAVSSDILVELLPVCVADGIVLRNVIPDILILVRLLFSSVADKMRPHSLSQACTEVLRAIPGEMQPVGLPKTTLSAVGQELHRVNKLDDPSGGACPVSKRFVDLAARCLSLDVELRK